MSDSPGLVDFAIGRVFEAGCIAPNLFVLLMFLVTVIPYLARLSEPLGLSDSGALARAAEHHG